MADIENVIIVGSGPAGYTAALYTARANLRPLVIEGFFWGGLLQQTTDVENYPGFPDGGIQGPELMQKLRDQAEHFGTRFITDQATKVELADEPGGIHKVWVGDDEYQARTVVLAMGAEHKKLGVPGEEELGGAGVSYCATCDAAFFKEHDTIIVGGGDCAMEEAIFLAKFASKVHIVHRRDEFRASKIMLERARAMENIEFLTPYVVEEFHEGGGPVRARRAAAQRRDRRGARAGRSAAPSSPSATSRSRRSSRARSQTDDEGYVITEGRSTRTGVPGVFAAGDLVDHTYRQAVTAAGLGLPGGARRRVVPARHAAGADARGAARGRPRRGPVGADQELGARLEPSRSGQPRSSGRALLSAAAAQTAPRAPAFLAAALLRGACLAADCEPRAPWRRRWRGPRALRLALVRWPCAWPGRGLLLGRGLAARPAQRRGPRPWWPGPARPPGLPPAAHSGVG